MANEFFTILTATGRNKLAAATATATPLTLTQMAVGDGDNGAYYSPTEAQTALKHEVWRGTINHLAVDANNPNWIVAELVIPDNVGGFYIREVGLFDSAGALIAVGKFPESYKPTLAAGSNKQLYVRMILEVANTSAVTLLVDPSVVLATRQYCDDKVADELNKRDSKQSVRVATTAAIALAGLQTIDGVVLVVGDRVLVKDQAAGAENGIYVAAAGAWARATDADSGTKLNAGALVPVEAGTVNADTIWMLKTDGAIIVGATTIAFQWAGGLNAPTQVTGDNSPKVANTAFVQAAIAALVASSPAALDTLNELAAALGNDANFAATVTNALALKAPLASPALTGTPTAPTPAQFDSSTKLSTMEGLQRALGNWRGFVADTDGGTFALTAADAGKEIVLSGSSVTGSLVLPQLTSVPDGAAFLVKCEATASNWTIATYAGDGANMVVGSASVASVPIARGDFALIMRGGNSWRVHGTISLPYSESFAASLNANGYQKLPSGLIVQWGQIVGPESVSVANVDVTFPITFPTACYQFIPSAGVNAGNLDAVSNYRSDQTTIVFDIPTSAGVKCSMQYINYSADARVLRYFAVGK